jgi:hypothetical protein
MIYLNEVELHNIYAAFLFYNFCHLAVLAALINCSIYLFLNGKIGISIALTAIKLMMIRRSGSLIL